MKMSKVIPFWIACPVFGVAVGKSFHGELSTALGFFMIGVIICFGAIIIGGD